MATNTTRIRPAGLSRFAQFAGIGKPKAGDDAPEKPEEDKDPDAPATQDDVQDVQDDVEDVQEDVEDVQDDVEDLTERVEELEDDKDPDEPVATAKPAEKNAYRKGRAFGAQQERKRISAIMGCEAAGKSRKLAVHYAFNTATSAKDAVAALSAAASDARPVAKVATPKSQGSALDKRMGSSQRLAVGTDAAARGVPTTSSELADSAVALARSAGIVK